MPTSPPPDTKIQKTVPAVLADLCYRCGKCLAARVCKTGALTVLHPGLAPQVEASLCTDCEKCYMACPNGAIAPNTVD